MPIFFMLISLRYPYRPSISTANPSVKGLSLKIPMFIVLQSSEFQPVPGGYERWKIKVPLSVAKRSKFCRFIKKRGRKAAEIFCSWLVLKQSYFRQKIVTFHWYTKFSSTILHCESLKKKNNINLCEYFLLGGELFGPRPKFFGWPSRKVVPGVGNTDSNRVCAYHSRNPAMSILFTQLSLKDSNEQVPSSFQVVLF
jgi:hypothetical protein